MRIGSNRRGVAAAVMLCALASGGCQPPQSVNRGPPVLDGGGQTDPDRGRGSMAAVSSAGDAGVADVQVPDLGPPPARCGDGNLDPGEECDDGPANLATEETYGKPGTCTRLCKKVTRYCGDGVTSNGEMCDAGMANSATAYGRDQCTTACKAAPFCGDGQPQPGQEECDEGPANTLDDKTWSLQGGGCNRACKSISRRCGDGTPDMPEEQCDLGMSNTADELTYGSGPGCNKSCKKIGYCGDGNRDYLEFCDEGANNTKDDKTWGLKMGGCNRRCMVLVAYCGDGHIDVPDEQCDAGPGRNTGMPGGCNSQCKTVPP
jgi:hypothetical protein